MSVAELKAISELVIWGLALFFVWMRLTDGSSVLGQTLGLTVIEQSPRQVLDTLISMGIFAALAELVVLGWFRARREAVDFRDERDRLIERKADQIGYWVGVAGASLIIGGAIGNVIDRLTIGAVVDFIDLHWHSWHWPAFNLADSAICLGALLLIIDELRRVKRG